MKVSEMQTHCVSSPKGPITRITGFSDDVFVGSPSFGSPNSLLDINFNNSTLLEDSPSQSPCHPSSEDSLYPLQSVHTLDTGLTSEEIWNKFDWPSAESSVDEMNWDLNELSDIYDERYISTTGKELRNHDCMWTGNCTNKEHVRNMVHTAKDRKVVAPGQTLLKNPVQPKDVSSVSVVPSSVMMAPSPMLTASPTVLRVPRNGVVARTSQGKSLLVRAPSRVGSRPGEPAARVVTVKLPSEDKDAGTKVGKRSAGSSSSGSPRSFASGAASPRPETPLSLSEEEDEDAGTAECDVWERGVGLAFDAAATVPRGPTPEELEEAEAAAALADVIAMAFGEDEEDCGEAVSITEVTGQVRMASVSSPWMFSSSSSVTDKSNACYLDHDYHKSNSSVKTVKTDHLGVQTPSDSEEEIDVVSLSGSEIPVPSVRSTPTPPASRNSKASAGSGRVNLPTNPSARDKQQLQLTVEAAMARVSANVAAGAFSDDCDEFGDSDEEWDPAKEMYGACESPEVQRRLHGYHYSNGGKSHGGKVSKRHVREVRRGPSAKRSRVERRHQCKRRQAKDEVPDYDEQPSSSSSSGQGNSCWATYSNSESYQSPSPSTSATSTPPRGRGGHRKRQNRQSQEYGDSAPEDPLERRSMHNTMERQRRIDLRNAFEHLRLLVPAVADKERAAKVSILREAASFCTYLPMLLDRKEDSVRVLWAKQEALRAQLSSLRKSLAAAR